MVLSDDDESSSPKGIQTPAGTRRPGDGPVLRHRASRISTRIRPRRPGLLDDSAVSVLLPLSKFF